MLTLQVLPTRTFRVKLLVPSLIGPDSTSNAAIWRRAGGLMSAIGAVFALLLVGQPFGSDAAALPVPFVAASPAAATTARTSTATAPITRGLQIEACRDIGLPGNRAIASSFIHRSGPWRPAKGSPHKP